MRKKKEENTDAHMSTELIDWARPRVLKKRNEGAGGEEAGSTSNLPDPSGRTSFEILSSFIDRWDNCRLIVEEHLHSR